MEPALCSVRESDRPARLARTAFAQRRTHARWVAVVPGGLDQHPPDMAVAGLRARPPVLTGAAAGLAGGEPEVSHQLARAAEAGDVPELGQQCHRGHGVDAPEAAQQAHRLAVVVGVRAGGELLLERAQPLVEALESAQVVVKGGLGSSVLETQG